MSRLYELDQELLVYSLMRSMESVKKKQRYADRHGDIGDIEDAGAETADAEVHEVDAASVRYAVGDTADLGFPIRSPRS